MVWQRNLAKFRGPVFFSHEAMLDRVVEVPRERRFGLLVESETQAKSLYRAVTSVMDQYALIFTHSRRLLDRFPNARWIPGGGCWIGGPFGGEEGPALFEKTKNVSILSSNKKRTSLHVLRYSLAEKIERRVPAVDVYRQLGSSLRSPILHTARGTSVFLGPHLPALDYLRDYRFSIVIENNRDDLYFTEKLLNCFATGTVPIYRGARSIGSLFDARGIIQWNNPRTLLSKLSKLNEDDYANRWEAIQNNFDSWSAFRSIEDYIVMHYGREISAANA